MNWIRILLARLASDVVAGAIREEEKWMDFVLALPLLGYPFAPPLDIAMDLWDEERLIQLFREEAVYDLWTVLSLDV